MENASRSTLTNPSEHNLQRIDLLFRLQRIHLLSRHQDGDHVVDTCTEKDHPDFGFLKHHSSKYKVGFLNGYNDSVAAASNDNGTYGSKECK